MDIPEDVKPTETETPAESSTATNTEEATQAESESASPEAVKPEEKQPDEEAETGEGSKKGAQARIKELNAEKKAAVQEAQSLKEKLAEITGSIEPHQYTPQVQPGQEVTPEQYKQDVIRSADAIATLRVKQSETINRINSEASEAVKKYPQLDPDSDSYDKELSSTVTEAVEAMVRQNPYSASVKKFVDRLMKPYERAVTNEVGKATERIAKQVTETALRPTQVKGGEKKTEDMTPAELEAKLGVVW